jgi:hypothetical protein
MIIFTWGDFGLFDPADLSVADFLAVQRPARAVQGAAVINQSVGINVNITHHSSAGKPWERFW